MKLQDTETHLRSESGRAGSLAFALDEFFDVLNVIYLKGDGARPSSSSEDGQRNGWRRDLETPRLGQF